MEGFDPVNSKADRRILYEVTGMRLYRDEFRGEGSTDSDQDDTEEALPIDYAFMYQHNAEDEDVDPLTIN